MKNLLILVLSISMLAACSQDNSKTEPRYMGLNGKFSSLEITYYANLQDVLGVEVYNFDENGLLLEMLHYSDTSKKRLIGKEIYKRDEKGRVIEEYYGFNLADKQYAGETSWQMIERTEDNKERWQKNDDDWWGTSYQDIEYVDGKKLIKEYVIQKKNQQESNVKHRIQTFNKRGQLINEVTIGHSNEPQNTTTWTYNNDGHLLKVELEQVFKDGKINKVEKENYTIDKVDDIKNPVEITDKLEQKWVYKFTYR